jgi:sRNA-binding carbon storage regulator CsrA
MIRLAEGDGEAPRQGQPAGAVRAVRVAPERGADFGAPLRVWSAREALTGLDRPAARATLTRRPASCRWGAASAAPPSSGESIQRRAPVPSSSHTEGKGQAMPALQSTRRVGEAIVLPGLGVTIRLLEVRGGTVRFDIEVPPGVSVARSEPPGRLAPVLARAFASANRAEARA